MIRHLYKHIGYYNNAEDIRTLCGEKDADTIVKYFKDGYGHFYKNDYEEPDTDLCLEDELGMNLDLLLSKDKKYVVITQVMGVPRSVFNEFADDADTGFYVDIYEYYKDETEAVGEDNWSDEFAQKILNEYRALDLEWMPVADALDAVSRVADKMANFISCKYNL